MLRSMFHGGNAARESGAAKQFDIICAGAALWDFDTSPSLAPDSPAFRPGRGAVHAALDLARQGLRVGLATVLSDDSMGRLLKRHLARYAIDVEGVALARPASGLFFVEGGSHRAVAFRDEEDPVVIPSGWTAQVLLVSGLSPVVAHAAALCKAARAARRAGSTVLVDVNARLKQWEGRDARATRMVLREADVVWCSAEDLLGLNMDVPSVRAAMRAESVFAMSDGFGRTLALGPFGEVSSVAGDAGPFRRTHAGIASTIGAALAKAGQARSSSESFWANALAHAS